MTLKELSIELGKPTHVLANTLRQVGLADYHLADDEQLNAVQIGRLRNGRAPVKDKPAQKIESVPYSIAALATKYDRGLADMVNIVKMSKLMPEISLGGDTVLTKEVYDELERRLSDKRIRLRALAAEMGIEPSKLTDILFEAQLINSLNWNQRLDKELEDKIRNILKDQKDSESEFLHLKKTIEAEIFSKEYMESLDMPFNEASMDEKAEDDEEESESQDEIESYTVSSLSLKIGIAEGRVINILRDAYCIEGVLSSGSAISNDIADEIILYHNLSSRQNQAQLFANCYLRERETIWNNPVVPKSTSIYTPGTTINGKVARVDVTQRLIFVECEENSPSLFLWLAKKTSRRGILTFDEWDWELEMSRNMPQVGREYTFLILQNNPDEDLILSRRQILTPPEPRDGTGIVICHNPEGAFVYVRHENGSYGFISYLDLPTLNVEDGATVQLKLARNFKKKFGNRSLQFAQYQTEEEPHYNELWQGLSLCGGDIGTETNSWNDLVTCFKSGKIILGRITGINDGGFLLESLGNRHFGLFCPYSKAPTWIDKRISEKLIGANWLLKIDSDPEGEGNNTVVSAKLKPTEYERELKINGYYCAFICSCNENGANVLIENKYPMFIPNKFIGWGKENDSQQVTIGSKVIVKILKTEKGTIGSIRDAYVDPWLRVANAYPIGTVIDTTIVHIEAGYIRLDLNEYIGHLPATEISWTEPYIADCRNLTLPESIRVVVTDYHEKSKTVQVSMKRLLPNPWTELDKHLPEDNIVSAEVKELTLGGAKLKVGELGFYGYLSYRDVDWGRDIDKSCFPYKVGETIEVKITCRNTDRRQLTCSIKALVPNPWEALIGKETIEGTVIKVSASDSQAQVRIIGGIECTCKEALDPDLEGQTLTFDILRLNVAAQQIVISYRKREIVSLNTLAVGEMFKKYRNLTDVDKELIEESGEEEGSEVYRDFIVKEVSSTGRVMAVYAEDDGEYENGILLPGSVTIEGYPVNVIFARQIIKQHIKPGEIYEFKVTHRYEGFNYAVLAIDAAMLLDLDNIATDDLASLTSVNGVETLVLHDICTNRNLFVQYNGYFGYIPRIEAVEIRDELPERIRVKSVIAPEHPGQMIRFAPISKEDQEEETEEQKTEKDLIECLDRDLFDCYMGINGLGGFNPKLPDYYPFTLQLRYNPDQQQELAELLASEPTYFSSQTFFLDCFKAKGDKGHVLNIFNNNISISAFCSEKEDGDEIRIKEFIPDVLESAQRGKHYGKPLRIIGENLQIVPLNSSAMPPAQQDADIVMAFIKYNREVLPELKRLSRDGQQKRGEHYLTLQELLKMDLKREESLCLRDVKIKSEVEEVAGSRGGYGIAFDAAPEAFDSIMSKDDSVEGLRVIIKPADNEPFKERQPSGVLKYLGSNRWIVELYANRDVDIAAINQLGISIKRFPNIRHLKKQIIAIDNFVFERNGLDIFSRIARNKLTPVEFPPIESIDANTRFNLQNPDDSQANALKMAIGGSQISLIQGPPGTGKSTVIVDIIRNLVKRHKKVLVCTQSVAPVEELYFKLSGRKDDKLVNEPVKIDGHPLRCAYIRDDESIEISGSVVERRNALKDMMRLVKKLKDINASANNDSIDELKTLKDSLGEHHKEECVEVVRKFAKDILPQCYDVLDIMSEYHDALDKEDVENFASEHRTLNLDAVDVVFGTCIGVGVNPLLRELHFDTLIIDEAGKANYAESLVPMMMADEYVLVGDHKQLPPYTNSELVKEMAMKRLLDKGIEEPEVDQNSQYLASEIEDIMKDIGKSLFGDLIPRLPESNQIMLSKQFRMHPVIGDFVSKLFYDSKVVSEPKPADRILNIKGLENPIKFIDTSGMGNEARESRHGLSLYNDGEIQVIEEALLPMLESVVESGKSVGILSPYGAQVTRMRERFPKLRKHIFTIDSIQGEEYDVVVFSFVRNTRSGSLNFVDDLRRLNVSFSRAKCNLIMIGHLDTLRNESLHKVDKEAVMAVYDEISNNKIELVVHHGAMQRLYDDFPPALCSPKEDLDDPYYDFKDCRYIGNGQFSTFYKGKLLSIYNPVLKTIPKDKQPENFCASLIGYVDGKPHTKIEPTGLWLTSQSSLKNFRFKAQIKSTTSSGLTLELNDNSLISLSVPNPCRFTNGMLVEVEVRGNRKFTVKIIGND